MFEALGFSKERNSTTKFLMHLMSPGNTNYSSKMRSAYTAKNFVYLRLFLIFFLIADFCLINWKHQRLTSFTCIRLEFMTLHVIIKRSKKNKKKILVLVLKYIISVIRSTLVYIHPLQVIMAHSNVCLFIVIFNSCSLICLHKIVRSYTVYLFPLLYH